MSLDIGDALTRGARRATARNAVVLFALFAAVGLVGIAASQTLAQDLVDQLRTFAEQPGDEITLADVQPLIDLLEPFPLALPVPTSVALVLQFAAFVLGETVRVVSDRTFVSDDTGALHQPWRNLALATVNSVVASLVIAVLLSIGTILLLLPALLVAVVFFFTRQEIAVEDENFVDALAGSVRLTKGSRFELFALAAVLFVLGLLLDVVAGTFSLAGPLVGAVAGVVVSAAFLVFAGAVAAQAYRQLREERDRDDDEPASTDDRWDDPPGVEL